MLKRLHKNMIIISLAVFTCSMFLLACNKSKVLPPTPTEVTNNQKGEKATQDFQSNEKSGS